MDGLCVWQWIASEFVHHPYAHRKYYWRRNMHTLSCVLGWLLLEYTDHRSSDGVAVTVVTRENSRYHGWPTWRPGQNVKLVNFLCFTYFQWPSWRFSEDKSTRLIRKIMNAAKKRSPVSSSSGRSPMTSSCSLLIAWKAEFGTEEQLRCSLLVYIGSIPETLLKAGHSSSLPLSRHMNATTSHLLSSVSTSSWYYKRQEGRHFHLNHSMTNTQQP